MVVHDVMKQGFVVVAAQWTRDQVLDYVRGLEPDYAVIRRQVSPAEVYIPDGPIMAVAKLCGTTAVRGLAY